MKKFFGLFWRGLAVIIAGFVSVACTFAACYRLFVELPTATGMTAVGMFLISLIWLAIGILTICGLGCAVKGGNDVA